MISYFSSELLNLNNSGLFLPKSIWCFLRSIGISNQSKGVVGLGNMLNPIRAGSLINPMLILVLQ